MSRRLVALDLAKQAYLVTFVAVNWFKVETQSSGGLPGPLAATCNANKSLILWRQSGKMSYCASWPAN